MQVMSVSPAGDAMFVLHSNGVQMFYDFGPRGVVAYGSDGTEVEFRSPMAVGSIVRMRDEFLAAEAAA